MFALYFVVQLFQLVLMSRRSAEKMIPVMVICVLMGSRQPSALNPSSSTSLLSKFICSPDKRAKSCTIRNSLLRSAAVLRKTVKSSANATQPTEKFWTFRNGIWCLILFSRTSSTKIKIYPASVSPCLAEQSRGNQFVLELKFRTLLLASQYKVCI
jgi:hypothetical protein